MQTKTKSKSNLFIALVLGLVVLIVVSLVIIIVKEPKPEQKSALNSLGVLDDNKIYTFDISPQDHFKGDFNAPVTLVIFSDLGCAYSNEYHQVYKQLLMDENYQDKIRLVWRHYPLTQINQYSKQAAVAAECAGQQDQFWYYIDYLYEYQDQFGPELFNQAAVFLNLDQDKFKTCLEDPITYDLIEANYQEGYAKGVRGTPTSFINGKKMEGALYLDEIKALIDEAVPSSE